jgi:hypothetical protein
MIPLAQTDHEGVARAMEAATGASERLRICLSIDDSTLERLDSRKLAGNQVGLVLDRLTMATCMSSIVHDLLEAVRFDSTFITDSLRSIRIDAALRAMLSLSRSLGLATLGSIEGGQRAAKIFEHPFDYVAEVESPQARLLPASGQAQAKSLRRRARAGLQGAA